MKQVNITWKADGNIDSYTIYRVNEPFPASPLPLPTAEGITTKSYIDELPLDLYSKYYYRIESVRGNERKISELLEVIVEPEEPIFTISCDGAINSALYAIALDQYGVDNIEEVGESGQFVINGVSMPMYVAPSDMGIGMMSASGESVPYPIDSGFTVMAIQRLYNLGASNKTVEIKSSSPHLKFYLWDNPTVNRIDGLLAQHTGVCFSGSSGEGRGWRWRLRRVRRWRK